MIWTRAELQELMTDRAQLLTEAVIEVHEQLGQRSLDGICLLHSMLTVKGGAPQSIELQFVADRAQAPTYVDWSELDISGRLIFRLPTQTVDKFVEVANQSKSIGPRRDFWHFDVFLIHELMHAYQGMERGKHRGFLNRAPLVLAVLDYEADATAVLSLFVLALLKPECFFGRYTLLENLKEEGGVAALLASAFSKAAGVVPYWGTLSRIIHAQVWHLAVFTAAMIDTNKAGQPATLSLEIASGRQFPLAKLERTFAWFLQYYRAVYFRAEGRVAELTLHRPPLVEFRNLRAAASVKGQYLKRTWPALEPSFLEETLRAEQAAVSLDSDSSTPRSALRPDQDDTVVVAAIGQYGMTRITRWNPSNSTDYPALFEAMFNGRLDGAKPFFRDLLQQNAWLIGCYDNSIRGSGPDSSAIESQLNERRDRRGDFLPLADPAVTRRLLAEFR